MRTYVAVTAILFVVITIAHVYRTFVEPAVIRDPWFIATTVVGVGMTLWAVSLLRRTRPT